MNQEILQAIAQFMSRVTLQAGEIETFQLCQQALRKAFDEAAAPEATDEPEPET